MMMSLQRLNKNQDWRVIRVLQEREADKEEEEVQLGLCSL